MTDKEGHAARTQFVVILAPADLTKELREALEAFPGAIMFVADADAASAACAAGGPWLPGRVMRRPQLPTRG